MSGDDPIAAYLERVSRALGRWHPGRRRILAEIEDHLREKVDADQTAEEAVRRFGDAAEVAAGLARPTAVRRRITAGGLAVIVAAAGAGGVDCEPPGRTRAVDMSLLGGSGLGGPFILYGTAPRAATELAITDAEGRTRTFALPRVPVRGESSRQAVILDLTTVGIHSCHRLALLAGGRVFARQQFIPA
jgi:hypothetical protein